MKIMKHYLVIIVLIISYSPLVGQTSEDDLINSYWLTDRIFIIGYGEMKTDMVVAVKTRKGIVIIDSGNYPTLSAKYKSIIEKEFGRSDFKYVINTHHHGDHNNGNQVFKEAEIVGHKNIIRRLQEDYDDDELWAYVKRTKEKNKIRSQFKATLDKDTQMYKRLRDRIDISSKECEDYDSVFQLTLPTITFSDKLTLNMGDLNIELIYFGCDLHTDNDILVSIPEENIVFTGDIIIPFNQYYNVNSKSDISSWVDCLNEVSNNNEIKNVVAYHMGVLPSKVLKNFRDSLTTMQNDQELKKSAVDNFRTMIAASNVQEAVNKFEGFFLKNRNEDYYIWEGDLRILASEYQEKEKLDDAILILKLSEKLFPNSTMVLYYQAAILIQQKKNNLAIEAYKKMLSIDPTSYYYASLIYQLENDK